MFQTFGSFHLLMISIFILIIILVFRNKELLVKHDKYVRVALFIIGPLIEIIFVSRSISTDQFWRAIPNGMCQTGVFVTSLMIFKYHRRLNILGILLSAGGVLTIIASFAVDNQSLLAFRPHYFLWIHFFIVIGNIYFALKHNLVITRKDYSIAMFTMLGILTYCYMLNLAININTVFFTSGPHGTGWIDKYPYGVSRVIITYLVYITLYSMPYATILLSARVKSYIKSLYPSDADINA